MLYLVLRKMLSNKWMLLCTILGSIITVGMLGSIPVYSDGIMQRMLTKDLEAYQLSHAKNPGGYLIKAGFFFYGNNKTTDMLNFYDQKISSVIAPSLKLPVVTSTSVIKSETLRLELNDTKKDVKLNVSYMQNLMQHARILHGEKFSGNPDNGCFEVVVTDGAMKALGLTLGNTYDLDEISMSGTKDVAETVIRIKVIGIFTYKDLDDPFWFENLDSYNDSIFIESNFLNNIVAGKKTLKASSLQRYYAYDYHKITLGMLDSLMNTLDAHEDWFKENGSLQHELPMAAILDMYNQRAKQLNITLLILQIPVLFILAFYSFMISKLKIDFECNEIAVMKSRGASGMFIFSLYLLECLIIGFIAMSIGPVLGLYICKIIGLSNGFLVFVNRSALPLALNIKAYLYSLAAVIFISISMLIPAFIASRTSIVLYKQRKSRGSQANFWKRYFIDVALLAASLYGLTEYNRQQKVIFISGVQGTELIIDPLLFAISTLFILGSSLLVLRVFPYLVSFIFWLGKKVWRPVFYASFLQVGRTSGQSQFVMILIIMTLSIGLFSANSARTINKNLEEKIRYEAGADIVVKSIWTNNHPVSSYFALPDDNNILVENILAEDNNDALHYFEPPFDQYLKLSGVESVTKVFRKENAKIGMSSDIVNDVTLMGIIPNEFGKTIWFRKNLLPYHINNYLNLMTDAPTAVLVSRAFETEQKARIGDKISVSWSNGGYIDAVIYAFVDYWPALNPNVIVDNTPYPYFVIANLNYIQAMNIVEPYQVWLKKKPGITSNEIYNEMDKNRIVIDSKLDVAEQIINRKNDPAVQGSNGTLTLGFIVTMIISIIGFLIYWILSIKARVLQFSIFRAIGLSLRNIIGMLVFEQFLITGTSVISGIFVGSLASNIFVPLLQLVYGAQEQVPPFMVISNIGDYLKLYFVVGVMLVTAISILWRIVSRINISQAIKLGEE